MSGKRNNRKTVTRFIAIILLLAFAARGEDFEFFEKNIRPVLVDNCYKCHSATSEKVKGGLLLDSKEGSLKGGDTGPAIVPGDLEKSLLIKAVRYTDKDLQMPPKDKKLPDAQIADLVAWVKMGAPDPRTNKAAAPKPPYDFAAARKQWAFHPPQDPSIPTVKNKKWVKSPIDNFIEAKLEEKDLSPAPPADKRTLIRRATFDLTGLPPTPQEVEDFLKDKSTNAFEKVVDRLLASPHYGERWGRHWLDVVRFTDSLDSRVTGSEADIPESYRYRDWVVNAFNQDLPYNQFVREQIAGDLLQPKDPDKIDTNGIIATGMYAIGNWGNGDADKDKILTDIADDQVDVTGRAFLGLTLACARCHDHKFDPIPTADYYSLAGIFFSSHILPSLTPKGQGENLMFIPLAAPAELNRRTKRDARIAELDKQINAAIDEQLVALSKKILAQSADYLEAAAKYRNRGGGEAKLSVAEFAVHCSKEGFQPSPALLQRWVDYVGFGDVKLLSRVEHDVLQNKGLIALRNAANADTPSGVVNTTDKPIRFITILLPELSVGVHPSPSGGVGAGWRSPVAGNFSIKGRVADADPNCGDGIAWELELRNAAGRKLLCSGAIPNGGAQNFSEGTNANNLTSISVNEGDEVNLIVLPKAEYSCDTTVIELELAERDGAKRTWNLTKDMIAAVNDGTNPYPDQQGNKEVWRIYDAMGQSPAAVAAGTPLAKWYEAVNKHASDAELSAAREIQIALLATNAATSTVSNLFKDLADTKGTFWSSGSVEASFPETARNSISERKKELADLRKNMPPTLARTHGIEDGGVPGSPHEGIHDVKIHIRGKYDHLGDLVPRRFPRVLAGDDQPSVREGSGRRQLADWVASPDNPLTARVMVNRIWQHHFGQGIVRTPNNYGKLGTPPTHPELLDYLAHRFIDSGWSIKAMHRTIMLSAVYQQSSVPLPATLKADPDNLLFGHVNRRRLESEALRDSMLDVGGKLDLAMGGPAIRDLNTLRRTLYVMTIRSDRATYQFLFDAADPNTINEQRIDSTVAPQALFLMNHPFTMAQTKALVARLEKEGPKDDAGRVQWLYQLLYGRQAEKKEIKVGLNALQHARAGMADKELAWEEYCQVLLCANEFIYVD